MPERTARFQGMECRLHGFVFGVLCCRHIANRIFERSEIGNRGILCRELRLRVVACEVCLTAFADVHMNADLAHQNKGLAIKMIAPACPGCFAELGGVEQALRSNAAACLKACFRSLLYGRQVESAPARHPVPCKVAARLPAQLLRQLKAPSSCLTARVTRRNPHNRDSTAR